MNDEKRGGENRHIHLSGICGVGMAPVAVMLKEAGFRVTGSDKAAFPPMSEVLAAAGITVMEGYGPANLDPRPDLVVIGNALTRTNPEAVAVEEAGIDRISFPEAVERFFLPGKRSLVVAGTHGKTTTTGMLAHCLAIAGEDPGFLVGGLVRDLGVLARRGEGQWFVIEGDEYDTAYFDKGPKFLHYAPSAAIVTSVEFDHADIYTDVEHVKSSFRKLADLIPSGAPLVGCVDYPHLLDAVDGVGAGKFIGYGESDGALWQLGPVAVDERGTRFTPRFRGKVQPELRVGLVGAMNALNALAVTALWNELGLDKAALVEGLASYRGAARRQEILGEASGVVVIDDFAHHPTAVAASLAAIRERFPTRRIWAAFEPRSNTSRRAVFQQRYTDALAAADCVALGAVYAKPNDPLSADEMLSTERIIADLVADGTVAWTEDGPDAILERLLLEVREGDVVVAMSNGAFGGLPRRLLAALGPCS
ncbi:MAG: UDP-N-acetylmuramate: L-alanyl-gamma-D-glutamyl-meso-diaminopimelate ligase [Candidatus Binatia bacterium]|jgi:UDP-N-acetylmuramate: L-alanyl-gamma-D-glutamyl-meso-diaminopimelate ligase